MIVVHGGVGLVTPEREARLRGGVRAAAQTGEQIIARGASAIDAVVAAVRLLEQDSEFGACAGSALTRDGTVETGASVMDGATARAGAVTSVPNCAAPVILARRVMEMGEHVVLTGPAALELAHEIGLPPAAPGSLITPRTQQQLADAKAKGGKGQIEGGGIGVVARDAQGNFAAATSTGGVVYRRAGSVDDAAIPGVGTWANKKCAVATTGGEVLFRVALAHQVAMRIELGQGLRKAVKEALGGLKEQWPEQQAGVIVVGEDSWVAMQIGPAMPTGWCDSYGANDELSFPF